MLLRHAASAAQLAVQLCPCGQCQRQPWRLWHLHGRWQAAALLLRPLGQPDLGAAAASAHSEAARPPCRVTVGVKYLVESGHRSGCMWQCARQLSAQAFASQRRQWTGWCSCLRSSEAPMRCCDASMAVSSRARPTAELCSSPCSHFRVNIFRGDSETMSHARSGYGWQDSGASCLPGLRRGCP